MTIFEEIVRKGLVGEDFFGIRGIHYMQEVFLKRHVNYPGVQEVSTSFMNTGISR